MGYKNCLSSGPQVWKKPLSLNLTRTSKIGFRTTFVLSLWVRPSSRVLQMKKWNDLQVSNRIIETWHTNESNEIWIVTDNCYNFSMKREGGVIHLTIANLISRKNFPTLSKHTFCIRSIVIYFYLKILNHKNNYLI